MESEATARTEILFPAREFNPAPVYIGGLGALGGHTAVALGKLGVANLNGCDRDIVSPPNIGTSIYGPANVGYTKASQCQAIVSSATSVSMRAHDCFIQEQDLEGVVMICVHDMDVRKEILFEHCTPRNGVQRVARVFEGRMSAETITIHSLDPGEDAHLNEWMRFWFPQSEALPALAGCGETPVGADYTAAIAGRLMAAMFVRWFAFETGRVRNAPNQVRYDLSTFEGKAYYW